MDLQGATVLPGFHDCSMRALDAGSIVGKGCKLSPDESPTSSQMTSDIQSGITRQRGTEWLLGKGFDLDQMLDMVAKLRMKNSSNDPKTILDDIVKGPKRSSSRKVPAVLLDNTGAAAWVNTEALKRSGMDERLMERKIPLDKGLNELGTNVPGGVILWNQYAEPNGLLIENALNQALNAAMDPNVYPTLHQTNYDGVIWSLRQLAKSGITSFCETPCHWKRGEKDVWRRLDKEGRLTARVHLALWLLPEMDDEEQIQYLKRLHRTADQV